MLDFDKAAQWGKREKPRKLLVFLHGYGSNGQDLIGLSAQLLNDNQQALALSPDALECTPFSVMAYQWFALETMDRRELDQGTARAAPAVNTALADLLQRYQLEAQDLALFGFSQGAMMALQVGLQMPKAPALIMAYSGVYTNATQPIKSKPPVVLVHGTHDQVVPYAAFEHAQQALERQGLQVHALACQGLGHSIDARGIDFARKALARLW